MRLPKITAGAPVALALTLAACGAPSDEHLATSAPPSTAAAPEAFQTLGDSPAPTASPDGGEQDVVGAVVRFTAGDASVDVTIGEDSPATRDFLSMLPLTVELEEFNGREKIADLPRELDWGGSPGSNPDDGDLIYYTPWGNLGFYYEADGIGYSDSTLHLGTYEATAEELSRFEGRRTTVEIVE